MNDENIYITQYTLFKIIKVNVNKAKNSMHNNSTIIWKIKVKKFQITYIPIMLNNN